MLNKAHLSETDTYYNNERPSIAALITQGPNAILDLGCGAGAVGRKLMEVGKASKLIGVELFESAAQKAARHYTKVYTGDIEELTLPFGKEFDYVLCGDILEHLKNPYAVVARIRDWLKDEGTFIMSVPNIRHWKILTNLVIRGEWRYEDAGIMDRTHLRFFTPKSSIRMLEEAGFQVERRTMFISGRKFKLLDRLTFGCLDQFLGSQTLLAARKKLL